MVVVGVVVAVVVGVVVADDEFEVADDEFEVAEELEEAVAGVETAWVAVVVVAEEWAVVSDATRMPRPTASATAARPTAPVVRRTRAIARLRARAAG